MEPNIWYKQTGDKILTGLTSSRDGLSADEALRRLLMNGPNELDTKEGVSSYRKFLSLIPHFFYWLLIIALLISVFLGAWVGTAIILSIAFLYLSIRFAQDLRVEKSIERSEKQNSKRATVYRDGQIESVPAAAIVTGDVIVLNKGDSVAADARIIESTSLHCVESAITGDPDSVEKNSAALDLDDVPLDSRENMVFMGTRVSRGNALAVVVTTALNTELGRIPTVERTKASKAGERILFYMTVFIAMMLFASLLLFIGILILR